MPIQSSMGAHKLDVRYGDRSALPYYNGTLLSTAEVASCNAGRVYSLTTAGLLVPGILAAAGAAGGVLPLFGLSGLDLNNYPDTQRDRGMPGYSDLGFTATATATLAAGAVTAITVATPGWYSNGVAPTVTITGDGANATAVAVLTLGRVTSIVVTAPGTGYTTATVTLSPPSIGNVASAPGFNGIGVQSALTGPFATIQHNAAAELSTTEFDTSLTYVPGTPLTALSATGAAAGLKGRIRTGTAGTNPIVGYVAPAGVFTGPEGYPTLAFTPAYVAGATVLNA